MRPALTSSSPSHRVIQRVIQRVIGCGRSVLVVSFADVRRCVEDAYADLTQTQPASFGQGGHYGGQGIGAMGAMGGMGGMGVPGMSHGMAMGHGMGGIGGGWGGMAMQGGAAMGMGGHMQPR